MTDTVETEWQFDTDDLEDVRTWIETLPPHEPFSITEVRDREQVDIYYDTAEWQLYRAGFSLRRRQAGEVHELTLKALTPRSDGPVARREITEASSDGAVPGEHGPVSDRVRAVAGTGELRPLFEVRTHRRTHAVEHLGERVALLELDEATIAAPDGAPSTFRRVEVEMVSGAPTPEVESFVAAMAQATGLRPTTASKFETGLRLAGLEPPA